MSAKGQTNWSSEQLEEWAKPALEHPELVEIARTATSNNEAKDEALKWVTKTHENLGQACRWLRILRVKYPERFEKFIKQEEKEMGEKTKDLSEMGFRIPSGVVIKSVVGRPHDTFLTFPNEEDIFDLCGWLLRGIDEAGLWEKKYPKRVIPDHNPPRFTLPTVNEALIEEFIRVLEERRGLKVKICGSCKHMVIMTISGPTCVLKTGKDTGNTVHEIDVCDINSWDPKEAPKGEVKLESAPTVKELQEKSTRGAVEIHASKK